MKNLIIPMAGKSSRFPNVRPKWMLTHPSGNFMVLVAISGLDLSEYDKIVFTYLKEHEHKYKFRKAFEKELYKYGILNKVCFVELEEETKNQPETVYKSIKEARLKGSIFIKDSDNYFQVDKGDGNYICISDLNMCGLINPSNKSYVMMNDEEVVINIVEKKVISPYFCVGGYCFDDAQIYCNMYEKLKDDNSLYISNLIYESILDGQIFKTQQVSGYSDWGTLKDWRAYTAKFATLFIDIDGVIVKNAAAHFPPYYGDTDGIQDNVEILKKLFNTGKVEIVLTTSRGEEHRNVTLKQLDKLGIKYKHIIMGLQHSKRIIINDYATSNPYKSCDSINIKRNSSDLKEILNESLNIDFE